MFDTVIEFFLGTTPATTDPVYLLFYVARLLVGIMLFDAMFDLFRFTKRLFK